MPLTFYSVFLNDMNGGYKNETKIYLYKVVDYSDIRVLLVFGETFMSTHPMCRPLLSVPSGVEIMTST